MDHKTKVLIAGGGPAGMVAALLLARAGINVTVMEKHGDFLRDFRGDTVHPSTLTLLDELGLGEKFGALPQSRITEVALPTPDGSVVVADMKRLNVPHPYVAMVPQWDLLDLLADAGRRQPTFTLRMNTEVTGLIREGSAVRGVRYRDTETGADGEARADLTIAADGRWSIAREKAGLPVVDYPMNIDVWWFRLPRHDGDPYTLAPTTRGGDAGVAIPREGYFQMAVFGPKGTDAQLRADGIEKFRARVARLFAWAGDRVDALESMDEVRHLDVRLSLAKRWHVDGLLCIGDAAHAMSPVGGVGINLAIQDAVAAATLLAEPLRRGAVRPRDLARVRARRYLPTVAVQGLQRIMHRGLVGPLVSGAIDGPPPAVATALRRAPWLSYLPARLIGVGLRPEHAPDFARSQSFLDGSPR